MKFHKGIAILVIPYPIMGHCTFSIGKINTAFNRRICFSGNGGIDNADFGRKLTFADCKISPADLTCLHLF